MIDALGAEASQELAAVHARAFSDPWCAAEIVKLLENPAAFAFATRERDGFVMAWAAAGEAEILTLAVAPESRRSGVGARLVSAAMAAAIARGAKTMHLEVAESNAPARALYKKCGFGEVGRRRSYYSSGGAAVDAIVMRRALPGL